MPGRRERRLGFDRRKKMVAMGGAAIEEEEERELAALDMECSG
ncbi:hypothetical protein COLO4_38086 [Corchorus olitorius]|uniref:Uncharacterized protein n=1 Tax=Corchorus olitorius TaxID=93759 RepID=A0A1R3FX32_9ROSI|nr:hypothetical protein COLO4_38086 [Corchorus olitorius]